MPWESAISTWYPAGYEVVLITSRSPTMRVVPPLPMNWALFVFQLPAVRDAKAMLLTTVFAPPPVVIVSLDPNITRLNSSHLIISYHVFSLTKQPMLTPITRGP